MDGDSEQMFHDLEQRHILLRKEHDVVCIEKEAFKGKLATLQNEVDELRGKLVSAQSETLSRDLDLKQVQRNAKTLEDSVEDIHDRYRRRSEECDRLRDDIKYQSLELTTVQSKLRDSQTLLSTAEGQLLPVQYELSKSNRDRDLLIQQAKELQETQIARTSELQELRRSGASKAAELEVALSEALADAQKKQDRVRVLQDSVSNQQDKINSNLKRIEELETAAAAEKGTFSQETEGLRRIGDLYKRHFEEATEEVRRLEVIVAETKEASARQISMLRDSLQTLGRSAEEKGTSERSVLEAKVAELTKDLKTEMSSRGLVTVGAASSSSSALSSVGQSADAHRMEGLDGFSAIEMYNRVASTERELSVEKGKRREADLYLSRILKDMERNAPVLLGQKRDLGRVLESHAQLTARLDIVGSENVALREQYEKALESAHSLKEDVTALSQHNSDLSGQIQHLLVRSMEGQGQGQGYASGSQASGRPSVALIEYGGETLSAQGVISEHLLTFDDISVLQTRNSQLLKVVRKLSADQESGEMQRQLQKKVTVVQGQTGSGDWDESGEPAAVAALQAAMKELSNLRDTRERTEEMVMSLVQQRDLYKAMLEEADITIAAKGSSTPGSGIGSPQETTGSPMPISRPTRALSQELQKRLADSEEEKTRIKERIARLEEAEIMLHERLQKALGDSIPLRVQAAQSSSEARFQRERCDRLESGMDELRLELSTATQRRLEMERLLVEQQREAQLKDDAIMQINDALRTAQDASRKADIEVEVTKAAESRLLVQLGDVREELKRQATFSESVRRIESGLNGRVEEEKALLVQERDGLSRALEGLRKQVADRTLVEDQRLRALEDDLRSARARSDEKTAEASSVREELVREQGLSAVSQERAAVSERQLSIAQERLGTLLGTQVIDSVVASEAAQRDVALDRALAEVESLQSRLAEAEKHGEQFRLIGTTTEGMLRELRERSAASKVAQEEELLRLKSDITALRSELDAHHSTSMEQERDIEVTRLELQEAKREGAERARVLEGEALRYEQAVAQHAHQVELLKGDCLKFQATARTAHGSYERELQLHATAERELKNAEAEMDAMKSALASSQHAAADLAAAAIRHERALQEEKVRAAKASAEGKEQMESLRTTNDILHGQVQSLGVQVDRLLENRAAAALGESSAVTTSASSTATATAVATSSDGGSLSNAERVLRPEVPFDVEEVTNLRKTCTELREVVRYMKRERDILEARQSVAEGETSRLESSLAVVQRALDEVRGELKRELDAKVAARGEGDFERLTAEVTQMNLVRESNAHLRRENEDLTARLSALDKQLKALKDAAAPFEEEARTVKADKEALEAANVQLLTDAHYWRDRLHQLVTRYNDVDPGEHRLLESKNKETESSLLAANEALTALQAKVVKLEAQAQQHAATMKTMEADILVDKNRYKALDSTADGLRSKLRDSRAKNEEASKRLNEVTQQQTLLQQRLATSQAALTSSIASASAAATAAKVSQTAAAAALAAQSLAASASLASTPVASAAATNAGAVAVAVTGAVDTAIIAPTQDSASTETVLQLVATNQVTPALAVPEGVQSAAAAVTAVAGLATKVAPVMDISIPTPASSIRFPSISAATATAVPVAAVVPAAVAVETTVSAAAPAVTPVVGKESMMREMLLKKRQGGAMGGLKGMAAAGAGEPSAKRVKGQTSTVMTVPVPAVPVVAPSSTNSDLSSQKMQVEVAQVVEAEVEDVAIDDLVPSSTPIPSAVVEEEADVAVAPTPVPVTTTVPATVPATVRFGSAVQEVAPSGFPVASGTNIGVSGLFPPSGNKSPFGSSFVTLAAGAGVGMGAGASTMPIATNNLCFLGTPSSTSAPASGGVQGFGGVASSLSAPFTFGSAGNKGPTFGSQLSMGFATGASASNISNIAEALPPSASESDAMVLQMHSEDSMGYISRDMAEGEGGEIEDDFEGTQSYFEDEHSHSQSSTFTQPIGSSFTPAPLSVPVTSSFGFSNPSSDAQKPSIFGSKRTLGETGFGSSVPSSSAGSSFVAAAPFFLLSQSSASPRIGGISGAVTGSANPFAIAPSLGFPVPTADAVLAHASALVPVPALSIASTPFSSPVPVAFSAPADVPVVSREEAVSSTDSSSAAASASLPTPTPTPASTPVATTPVVPVPAPARQAAGRKLKPKPAHLVAAIPAFAQVQTRTRGVAVAQKQVLQGLLNTNASKAAAATAAATAASSASTPTINLTSEVEASAAGMANSAGTVLSGKTDLTSAQMKELRAARFNTPAGAVAGKKAGAAMTGSSSTGNLQEAAEEGEEVTSPSGQEPGQEP